jgi:hypothetical protein
MHLFLQCIANVQKTVPATSMRECCCQGLDCGLNSVHSVRLVFGGGACFSILLTFFGVKLKQYIGQAWLQGPMWSGVSGFTMNACDLLPHLFWGQTKALNWAGVVAGAYVVWCVRLYNLQ